jgi:hypothetical protein
LAIDFMIMPLSRYLSGDFVTPVMRLAWDQGLPYTLVGPDGVRTIPKDTPFGGSDAAERRREFIPMLKEDLSKLPGKLPSTLWDEASSSAPIFHRVDPRSYEALCEEAKSGTNRPSLFGLVRGRGPSPSHLPSTLFLPSDFEASFSMPVIFERVAGSIPVSISELEDRKWSDASRAARDLLLRALGDAQRVSLPMIVDW